MNRHIEQVEAINAERAALPKDERVKLEAADAPLLRIQLAYAMNRAEKAEARTGPTDALEQRLAAMGKLAAAWQKEAERAHKNLAAAADTTDDAEIRIWCALERPLTEEEVAEHLKILRGCRYLAAEAIHVSSDTYKDAKKRVTALHAPVQHMGQTWCQECSVRRRTGPKTEEWVAFIPHPCQTLEALENKEPAP